MARTRRAVSPSKRTVPIDVAALRERAKKLEATIKYTVPITVKIDARMYEALVEATEKYEVRFADMVRRSLAEGLAHMTAFVTPYEEPFEKPTYKPGAGLNRLHNAYEEIQAHPVARETMLDESDPLVAAVLSSSMRATGMPRRNPASARVPSAAAHRIASALDDDDETPKPPEEAADDAN